MNLVFVVPLETRGAMIQARAVQEWCRRNDHRVVQVLGTRFEDPSPSPRTYPGFDAPGQVIAGLGAITRIDRHPSMWACLRHCVQRRRSISLALRALDRSVREGNADAVVSFMEPLAALHHRVGRSRAPLLTVGTALRLNHPDYHPDSTLKRWASMMGRRARWCSFGGLRYAVSLEPLRQVPSSGLLVGPPLVEAITVAGSPAGPVDEARKGWVVQLARPEQRHEVELWHQRHPETPIDCFYERSESVGSEAVDGTLRFHPLRGDLLKQRMADCAGIVMEAGFEALAQAATAGKPLVQWMSRPHPESLLHAHEFKRLGLSRQERSFHPQPIHPAVPAGTGPFLEWMSTSDARLAEAFTLLQSRVRRPTGP